MIIELFSKKTHVPNLYHDLGINDIGRRVDDHGVEWLEFDGLEIPSSFKYMNLDIKYDIDKCVLKQVISEDGREVVEYNVFPHIYIEGFLERIKKLASSK